MKDKKYKKKREKAKKEKKDKKCHDVSMCGDTPNMWDELEAIFSDTVPETPPTTTGFQVSPSPKLAPPEVRAAHHKLQNALEGYGLDLQKILTESPALQKAVWSPCLGPASAPSEDGNKQSAMSPSLTEPPSSAASDIDACFSSLHASENEQQKATEVLEQEAMAQILEANAKEFNQILMKNAAETAYIYMRMHTYVIHTYTHIYTLV